MNYNNLNDELFDKYCKDYEKIPPLIPKSVRRIIAIGDIHGDLKYVQSAFLMAGLMDQNCKWTGGDTVVVQTGDQIDSGYRGIEKNPINYRDEEDPVEDIDVLHFMTDMDRQARKDGGAVYSLLGNHEIDNVRKIYSYVSHNNAYQFDYSEDGQNYKGLEGRWYAFQPGGPLAKFLACTRNSALIIGKNIFMHANIFDFLDRYPGIQDQEKFFYLNYIVRKWLLHLTDKKENDIVKDINEKYYSFFDYYHGQERYLGNLPSKLNINNEKCRYVENILAKYGPIFKIGRLIVAHTIQDRINATCSNKVIRIDIGTNRAFKYINDDKKKHSFVEVLEIINDKIFKVISQPYNPLPTIKPTL